MSDLLASLVQQYIVGDDLISHARPWFPQIEEEEWAELDLEMQRPPRRRAVADADAKPIGVGAADS